MSGPLLLLAVAAAAVLQQTSDIPIKVAGEKKRDEIEKYSELLSDRR